MTISDGDEADAALSEMGRLITERPLLDSPKGRRLLWLTKELKDWLTAETNKIATEPEKAIARKLWADINHATRGWGG